MSKYTCYYNKNQKVYRELAERWARWAKTVKLSPEEIRGTSKFFYDIAVRFGLITEFRELGVIL
jgi:hypothetical protein